MMLQMRKVSGAAAISLIGLAVVTATTSATTRSYAADPASSVVGAAPTCTSGVPGDVNGDGFAEVAVGEPGNNFARGAVHVAYGQRSGLVFNASGSARNDQYFTQDTPGVPGGAEAGDDFGTDTVLADFNGDGCADLAVGSPGENASAGSVNVFYGSPAGLSTTGVQGFGLGGLFGSASSAPDQEFGDTLTAGDLDGDGIDDLAAGVMGLRVGTKEAAGGVVVLYGSTRGLNRGSQRAALLTRDTPGIPGAPEELGGFGAAVVTGNFDGDDTTELAIGMTNGLAGGAIQVVSGGPGRFLGSEPIGSRTAGIPGAGNRFCAFGFVLASGDVHGDGRDDLAVADPSFGCHDAETEFGMGAVVLLAGSSTGLTTERSQLWTQSSAGVAGTARLGNVFGESLAMGPLDRGATADLAIGAPGDSDGGSVTVLLGGTNGLTTAGSGGTRYTQATTGIAGKAEPGDSFGQFVTTAFLQSRSQASLLVGNPGEDVGAVVDAGSLSQLSIGTTGPDPAASQSFTADSHGVQGKVGPGEHFGGGTRRWG
jgi:hypothetical protein